MKVFSLFIVTLIFFNISSLGQTDASENINSTNNKRVKNIYFELGGAGVLQSLNVDFRLGKTKFNGWGFRIGIGQYNEYTYSRFSERRSYNVLLPIGINNFIGKKKHLFIVELGLTSMYSYKYQEYTQYNSLRREHKMLFLGYLNTGYRLQNKETGFMFQLLWSPVVNINYRNDFTNSRIIPYWFGIGLGFQVFK